MKKIFFGFVLCLSLLAGGALRAEDSGGQVVLDLQADQAPMPEFMPTMIARGYSYVQDVKEYDSLLDGDKIETDFTDDMRAKYPEYNEKMLEQWQSAVRKGVKGYRFYQQIKKEVMDWLMKDSTPLVVDDDQYEMGEDETYIESDKPVVIQKFRKVVAYSDSKQDQEAAAEKRAKDAHLPRPSEVLKKYKKALLERDWATLFDFKIEWRKYFESLYADLDAKTSKKALLTSLILPERNGLDAGGEVRGVIWLKIPDKHFVLFDDYQNNAGLTVDFGASENLEEVQVARLYPQLVQVNAQQSVPLYLQNFAIYFSGKAVDVTKPVVLRPIVRASVCQNQDCQAVDSMPELSLKATDKVRDTAYAAYIRMVSQNIQRPENKKFYRIGRLVLDDKTVKDTRTLKLEIENKSAARFKIFAIGEAAQKLADARVGIDGSQIMVQFDVLDADYNPLGQEIGFWMNDGAHPFETTLKVEKMSVMDLSSKHFSLGILGLALVGGLLLNLMPCVFPVLSLKLMAFTRFGGLNEAKIRRNFGLNSLGILSAFGLMAVVLAALKAMGYVLGWGMQFQNIYFMVAIIWVVTLFLAQVLGFINLKTPQLPTKVLQKTAVREKWFEFLSGVFLVVLSTPCMAPYLGTAFSVALAGNVAEIVLTVLCVGLGVACPYLLICAVPSVAAHLPKPGKWLNTVQVLMVVMLLITLVWLVSVLASQTAAAELWHWAIYIVLALVVLFFYKTVRLEIDKVEDRQLIVPLLRRFGRIFWGILIVLIGVSLFDVVQTAEKSRVADNVSKVLTINEALIKENVAAGGPVLVKVGAGWCLTCRYNDALVFDEEAVQDMLMQKHVMIIDVDWTRYNAEVLKFMQKFGRHGLPFYVLFSKAYPNGVVLSELPSAEELSVLLEM